MPVREVRCNTKACPRHGIIYEWFAKSMSKPDPNCPDCKAQMERMVSRFACIWTGTLDRFNELGKEQFQKAGVDGHYAWRVKSSRLPDGGPERVIIRTHQDQREYCKAEGLIMPDEINRNAEISSDGKTLATSGMKDQWGPVAVKPGGLPWLHTEE